ncbi:histidine kinase [Rubricoccus marinus]|uniref:histidine kinase n=1 Tax=Rubricoccus marinus TaxID=716817 RepID=UPI00117A81BF|nr:histidine kinase [Rubricoccus marinus]
MASVLALLPLAQLGASWWEYSRTLGIQLDETPPRGSVGVRWVDTEEGIVSAYVFPSGSAYAAGLRDGDRLIELDFQTYFQAVDVERSIERATGVVLAITALRENETLLLEIPVARDPTFLYALSPALWSATGWGFALATLLHVLALLSVLPLARRAQRARGAATLISAAIVWVGGNLARHLWVTLFGPPSLSGSLASGAFDALTLLALAGWIAFPALLFRRTLLDDRFSSLASRGVRWLVWVPPAVLSAGVLTATLAGHIGPLPPDAFVGPILFYVCVYVATSTAFSLWRQWRVASGEVTTAPMWIRVATAFVMTLALVGALLVYNTLPAFQDEVAVGWFVVALQLFSLLPVLLVSAGTLQYGRFRTLLTRSVTTGVALSAVFVLVVVGSVLVRTLGLDVRGAGPVSLGLWTVVLLLLADWLAPPVRRLIGRVVRSERQRGRLLLDRLGERVRRLPDVESMATATAETVGPALLARSAVVFLRETDGERWVRSAFRPEPPHFTVVELDRAWADFRDARGVWARNEELDETQLPEPLAGRLRQIGVALAVPIVGSAGEPVGLIALGRKERRFSVYNIEEVEALKSLGAQLALASERLALLERERALVRRTAEAELAALRAQINPHFLFNALNTIAALIAESPDQAESTVETLAGLFRDVLTSSGKRFVPLATELRLVERYLSIEQARFGDRLEVQVDIDDATLDTPVPAFAVQTLVENAVKHGIESKRGGGTVRLHARQRQGQTEITVADTGVGIPALFGPEKADREPFYGVGLTNVADRLLQIYGTSDRLVIRSGPDGTSASLHLPSSPLD